MPFMRGKAHLRIVAWVVAVLLALVCSGSYPAQNDSPNLRPFKPRGWSDVIVVSNRQGDNLNSGRLAPSDVLFVDFAVINSGGSPVTRPFRINLLVDGRLWKSFDVPAPLDPQIFRFREDYPIGRLGVGTHAIRIVADAENQVAESDEDDNEYTRSIVVAGDCFPLTTRVSPRGAGTLTPSREPNCGEATVSVSRLTVLEESRDRGLDIAGEPLVAAQRARAFDVLRAKVRSEDRLRVIVGVRTEGRSSVSAAGSLGEAKSRSPLIARAQLSLLSRMNNPDASSIRRFKFIPYVAMEVDEAALESLAADPEVVSIEEDLAVKPLLANSTSLIGAPHAWDQGFAGSGQTIAILDTGVDKDHPFLSGKVVSEACYSGSGRGTSLCPEGVDESILPGSGAPCSSSLSDCYHGTAMAGVAAGRGTAFSGVARDARIIAVQVFSRCGEDCVESSSSDWLAGLERVLELSADFNIAAVDMRVGAGLLPEDCDGDFLAVKAAMDNLRAVGIAPMAASGNSDSDSGIHFPACISSVVSVGSTDGIGDGRIREEVSDFSNSSPSLDLLAPGRGIHTSVPGGDFASFDGTSLAVPHVSGAWAVLKSKAPNATVPQLLSMLSRTGIPITDSRNGIVKPRIQVDSALDAVIPELSYSTGTHLTLTARPESGFRFTLWRGCDDASGNRCVVEIDSIKNVSAIFEPLGPAPDLLTTSLAAPATAAAGSEVSITAQVHNQGSVDAGPFRLGFYLSTDPVITPEDTWFAACTYDSGLTAGGSETCSRDFPIPFRVSPGRYYVGGVVDDLDRVAEKSETNNAQSADSGPIEVLAPRISRRWFVPVILNAAGRRGSFFTSELTLTNRGTQEARLDYTYTAHAGGGSGRALDTLQPGRQKIAHNAFDYLRRLGVPVRGSGNRIGTLAVEAVAADTVGVLVRTTTPVPEGRAGLAYPGVGGRESDETLYLCGLRQNERDRSNVAVQHMGTAEDGSVTLRAWVRSGVNDSAFGERVTLEPGGFHQFNQLLSRYNYPQGYFKVDRVEVAAPFYAYGVISDNGNSE
ncbi:MAG: S8 family serine peptidase, partial [Acidobacteria bacterium]|nr:S8 family serine peptidase [Acidobacteriota bacterium]